MRDSVKSIYDFTKDKWGYPQIYKGIELKPLNLMSEKHYEIFLKLMTIPKDAYKDRDILKASYLNFIVMVIPHMYKEEEDKSKVVYEFLDLMEYITNQKCDLEVKYLKEDVQNINDLKYYLHIGNKKITGNQFDDIREMILEQNGFSIDYVNQYIEELEKRLQQANSGHKPPTLEEEMFSFATALHKTIDEISHYTFYQFRKHFSRVQLDYEYRLFKPLEESGQIELKQGEIKHWLASLPKRGRYDSILIRKSDFEKDSDVMKVSKQV